MDSARETRKGMRWFGVRFAHGCAGLRPAARNTEHGFHDQLRFAGGRTRGRRNASKCGQLTNLYAARYR
eukprot:7385806-Prymnesium_polylepis.1